MDLYFVLKFFHVAFAIVWLGGGFGLLVLGILADRARDDRAVLTIVAQVAKVAPVLFVPGSFAVLVLGLAMVWVGNLAWDAWLVLGLGGIAVTIGLGAGVLGPMSEKTRAATEAGDEVTALALGKRMLNLAKIDYLVQFGIVYLMVVKPGWADLRLLAAPAVAIVLGSLLVMRPRNMVAI